MAANNSASGERRRRVLSETRLSIATPDADDSPQPSDARPRYSDDAILHVPRVSRVISRGLLSLALILIGLVAAVAGLAGADVAQSQLAEHLPAESLRPLLMDAPGSLASWFAAASLLASAVVCLAIYAVRRHRLDDYKGRYRLWLWTAAICVAASLQAIVRLETLVVEGLATASGYRGPLGGALWWIVPSAIVGGWLLVRMVLELRGCRTGLAGLLLAVGCWSVAACVAGGLFSLGSAPIPQVPTLLLAGISLWLMTLLAVGRSVVLEATTAMPSRKPQSSPHIVSRRGKPAKKKATSCRAAG